MKISKLKNYRLDNNKYLKSKEEAVSKKSALLSPVSIGGEIESMFNIIMGIDEHQTKLGPSQIIAFNTLKEMGILVEIEKEDEIPLNS